MGSLPQKKSLALKNSQPSIIQGVILSTMPSHSLEIPEQSLGLVSPQKVLIEKPLTLACGTVLPNHELVFETYGTLNSDKSNAILICHALSGNHHAAGFYEGDSKPGWWDHYIGPGKAMDSNRFFIVSVNNIGSCFGSTGPTSINPETGKIWGADFPSLRAREWSAYSLIS